MRPREELTQRELAVKSGVGERTIHNYVRDHVVEVVTPKGPSKFKGLLGKYAVRRAGRLLFREVAIDVVRELRQAGIRRRGKDRG